MGRVALCSWSPHLSPLVSVVLLHSAPHLPPLAQVVLAVPEIVGELAQALVVAKGGHTQLHEDEPHAIDVVSVRLHGDEVDRSAATSTSRKGLKEIRDEIREMEIGVRRTRA